MFTEYTQLESAQSLFSDLHKDVHGIRPRWCSDEQWNDYNWLNEQITSLELELVVVMAQEKKIEDEAVVAFEAKVADIIAMGAGDRPTALRWLFDGEDDCYATNDRDYFCYLHNLPYRYFANETF